MHGLRPHEAHLPFQRPRLPAHRRGRQCREAHPRLTMRRPVLLAATLLTATLARSADSALSTGDLQFFETKIRPVLEEDCFQCHSHQADRIKGRLMLDSRDAVLKGGNTGPAVVPGK